MATTLSDLIDKEVEIFCSTCGRPLGRYEVYEGADEGIALAVQPSAIRGRQPTRSARGRLTGARAYEAIGTIGFKLTWSCGCGARPQRRADRLGRLEVDAHTDPPRLFIK